MVACADVDLGHARRFAKGMEQMGGKCQVYQDYRKLLDRKDVQAVTDRHARPLARQDRHRRDARRQGRLLREAADADHRRGPADLQSGQGRPAACFRSARSSGASTGQCFLQAVAIARSGRLGTKLKAPASIGKAKRAGRFPRPSRRRNWIGTSGWARPRWSPSAPTAPAKTSAGGSTMPAAR